jgi:hypothetical protein
MLGKWRIYQENCEFTRKMLGKWQIYQENARKMASLPGNCWEHADVNMEQ